MENKIISKKIKTRNVTVSLKKFAAENNLSLKECDFTINHVDTYMKSNTNDDYQLYNEDVYEFYENEQKMLNEHVKIRQLYTITIKKLIKKPLQLKYAVEFDKYSINPKLIISPDSIIPYKSHKASETLLLLVKEINKIKLKNNILIKLFDDKMIKNLRAFTKYIYAKKFTKKLKISLFSGIDPILSRQSRLVLWYEEKNSNHQVIEVDKGEVLLEYKKAIFGKNGFNSFGQVIESGFSNNKEDYQYHTDDKTIEIIENDNTKIYKSKVKGFVHFAKNILSVDNKLKMRNLSRVQTSISKNEDNNIEVFVAQNDTNKDSIGEGVELQSEVIHVTGHVGAKSTLEALNLQIDGATHKDSIQYAKDAIINRHKGTLRSNTAKITLLEGGEVHASKVEVGVALGGSIYAENVIIGQVKSHLKVYASNSIEIKLVSGEDNIFKINYKDVPVMNDRLMFLEDEVQSLKYKLEGASKHTHTDVPKLKQKIKEIRLKQDKIKESAKYAKITIHKPLQGLNTIIFVLETDDEIIYKTDAVLYKPFYIDVHDDIITLHPVNKTVSIKL